MLIGYLIIDNPGFGPILANKAPCIFLDCACHPLLTYVKGKTIIYITGVTAIQSLMEYVCFSGMLC